jgi:hypothetical protein
MGFSSGEPVQRRKAFTTEDTESTEGRS